MTEGITITVTTSGQFKTGGALDAVFFSSGLVQDVANVEKSTAEFFNPVVSGRSKASWEYAPQAEISGGHIKARVQNTAQSGKGGYYYLPRVNRTSRRNAGFFQRATADAKPRALAMAKMRLAEIVHQLWERTK